MDLLPTMLCTLILNSSDSACKTALCAHFYYVCSVILGGIGGALQYVNLIVFSCSSRAADKLIVLRLLSNLIHGCYLMQV